jgi:SAM-dependent methyltransferase
MRPLASTRQRLSDLRRLAGARGAGHALRFGLRWALFPLWAPWARARGHGFVLDGTRYEYLLHGYNLAWSNERTVEVPVVWRLVQAYAGRRVLEVGNVLSHYYPVRHEVVDKFERAPGVVNADVAELDGSHRYDLIVSISTLEHVGYDEHPLEPDKPLRAVANLRRLLAPGGLLCATLPLGYNAHLDRLLGLGALGWTRLLALRRLTDDNRWGEADWDAVKECAYDGRWPGASGVVFGFIRA